jgi:peptide/nickel transport system substrate-binding protein
MSEGLRRRCMKWAAAATAGVIAVSLGAVGGIASASTAKTAHPTQATGGTVTFAEGPAATPNYIFPLASFAYFSVANLTQFQYLMYRPLYWFGDNNTPTVDYNLSLANAPKWSNGNKTVSITLKPWKWSDGETVSARDVVFWMNLLTQETAVWAGFAPGLFPDNVKSYTATTPDTVTFQLDKAYNPTWFLYNELSQITPLPLAWDRTALSQPAPTTDNGSLPDSTPAGAKSVYTFLDAQSKSTSTWVGSNVWSVVDGPWKLSSFTSTGQANFVPNPTYSGPIKPTVSTFEELPFTSDDAEFNQLRSGGSITLGYIPLQDSPQAGTVASSGYKVSDYYSFSFVYWPMNFDNPTFGPVFHQLYFRQAFQHLVDQPGWISAFFHGNAVPTYGPVPVKPPNPFVSKYEESDPYPFSTATAAKQLSSHGWKVVGGVATCESPGSGPSNCGAGIKKGLGLSFNLDYASGSLTTKEEMADLQVQAAKVGIKLTLTSHPFDAVIGAAAPCKATQASCKWTMENWGAGWIYSPDYYPSGEELFQTGAGSNNGSWNDPIVDKLIALTTTTSAANAESALTKYQNYVAQQVPVTYGPTGAGAIGGALLTAVSNKITGFTSNVFGGFEPEAWRLK